MTARKNVPPDNQFGRLIQTEREIRGWSVTETCRRATARSGRRFHATVLGRFESGQTIPDLNQALVLLNLFGVSLNTLADPRPDTPWIDGSAETLEELDDLVAGRAYVEHIDLDTGLRDVMEVTDDGGGLGELPEIPEEIR